MNKPVYLGLSILELSKLLMYEFWYDYVRPKYGDKAGLHFMGTDSFIVYIKIDQIYKDIPEDVEIRFDISNYRLDRPAPKGNNRSKKLKFYKKHSKDLKMKDIMILLKKLIRLLIK